MLSTYLVFKCVYLFSICSYVSVYNSVLVGGFHLKSLEDRVHPRLSGDIAWHTEPVRGELHGWLCLMTR